MMSVEKAEREVDVDNLSNLDKEADTSSDDMQKDHWGGEDENLTYDQKLEKFPVRFYCFKPWFGTDIYFNWFTSVFGFAFLWGMAIWCMAKPDEALEKLDEWKSMVAFKFTWFYIVANPTFTFFTFWLAYRYGDVKLGKPNEPPEFSDTTYFMMLFSAGIAVGLFFFGVAEPLWHQSSHWFAQQDYRTQDERDQFAMMMTMYHYGFAGWSPYLIVGIAAGIAAYRFDMPLTVRSCMYEIFGAYTWGWIGDVIDGFSIVMTVAGICTSLGLGAMQLVAGFKRMGWIEQDIDEDDETNINVAIIWVITAIATISVVSGLKIGIKYLSQIGFCLGLVQLVLCVTMENTKFIFNLLVQTVGYYFQWCLFQIPFWTDAFGQLKSGEGRAIDGEAAPTWWMDAWTVFYMAWWTAWGAFVGLFVGRISRGRNIRQVVIYAFVAPLVFNFLWFSIFGGTGIRQERQARELEELGEKHFNNSAHYLVPNSTVCYNVPQKDVYDNGTLIFENHLPGITPVCQFDTSDSTSAWFNVMYSFSYPDSNGFAGFGGFLSGLSLVAITIYFVTSSDSGSLVVDHLSANGHEKHNVIQRIFWAFTEGAVATALLVAGGSDALTALQAASIVFGLPFNLFLFFMMIGTVKMCQIAEYEDKLGGRAKDLLPPEDRSFIMPVFGGILNIIEFAVSFGQVHPERIEKGMDLPSIFMVKEFFIGLLLPFWSYYRGMTAFGEELHSAWLRILLTACYAILYVAWIAFFCTSYVNDGFVAFGFTAFLANGCILASLRLEVRNHFGLDGNLLADFAMSSFAYPQVLTQILLQFEEGTPAQIKED